MNGFNVLTILWPAGFEADWTASGLCELGDLKYKSGKVGKGNRREMDLQLENADIKYCNKIISCLSTCEMATHHLVMGVKKLSVLKPGGLRNSPIYCSLHTVTRIRNKRCLYL